MKKFRQMVLNFEFKITNVNSLDIFEYDNGMNRNFLGFFVRLKLIIFIIKNETLKKHQFFIQTYLNKENFSNYKRRIRFYFEFH